MQFTYFYLTVILIINIFTIVEKAEAEAEAETEIQNEIEIETETETFSQSLENTNGEHSLKVVDQNIAILQQLYDSDGQSYESITKSLEAEVYLNKYENNYNCEYTRGIVKTRTFVYGGCYPTNKYLVRVTKLVEEDKVLLMVHNSSKDCDANIIDRYVYKMKECSDASELVYSYSFSKGSKATAVSILALFLLCFYIIFIV
ncbi:hypothetical protein M0812_24325 [Anaeramoeba flamelloides]|uniref:Uncharacterized protein n=1 Tax=Anaeramoeba flamelloides TaxID=1746091 RepID=A0AAV7YGJ6_9EUKA|nr:hypothetical protein M0812_24325 [Anaeramoeba flamelloides]